MTEQIILTPLEAINEFYRLKDKYENGYYEKYVKPIVKSNKSKKEKRVEYSKLPKAECINCKRNVGTIFSVTTTPAEDLKKFISKCGDIQDPCPLDIQIDYSFRDSMDKIINSNLKEIERIKLNIIKEKNNALFFGTNVVNSFEKLAKELKNETEHTGFIIETKILRNDNPEKKLMIKETIDDFGISYILPFKQMIQDFNETNNELKINEAISFYINEMVPKLKQIQLLKYDINIVEYDEKDNNYRLIQIPNSYESDEYYIKGDDKVIKFIKGVRKEKKKTRKEEIVIQPKNKTRKLKPIADLVIEEDVDEIIPEQTEGKIVELEEKFAEPLHVQPVIDDQGNVIWNNEQYDNIWKKVPKNVANLLIQDPNWLEDYINSCIILRKNGKPCNLFLPKTTQFPPTQLENGQYDFGNEIVNRLFNKLNKSYQATLLTLYSEKDGIKNYNMMKDTLESILAKNLNYERPYI